jgi:hypothetical protein
VHECKSSIWKLRQEGHEFESSLGYVAKACVKINVKKKVLTKLKLYNFIYIKKRSMA